MPPDQLERPRRVGEHRKEAAGNLNAKRQPDTTQSLIQSLVQTIMINMLHEGATFRTSPKARVMSTRLKRWKLLRLGDHDLDEF